MQLVELPLNARIEDVVGAPNERAVVHRNSIRIERGILSRADRNILYIDEINLLDDQITDVILDAAAQGAYTVRRGAVVGTYRSRFVLVGSMNPEEGRLRPQIMDHFGLRVYVRGLTDPTERGEVYHRARAYRRNPTHFIHEWEGATAAAESEIDAARDLLNQTVLPDEVIRVGLELILKLSLDSHRAEYTMFEAARAYAAADSRTEVTLDDLKVVAPLSLRQRNSEFMSNFFDNQAEQDKTIYQTLDEII